MKGQVSFPVNALERMSAQRYSGDLPPRNVKLAKRRQEFLDVYDDLRSHLDTTFVTLSTAYAHNSALAVSKRDSASSEGETQSRLPKYRSAKIHIFLVIGSSPTLPKARVLLELNNFHVEKYGERESIIRQLSKPSSHSDNEGSENQDEDVNGTSATPAESDNEEAANNTSDTEEVDSKQFFSVPSTPRRTASFYTASASPSSEPPSTPSSRTSESSEESEHSSPETSLSEDRIATVLERVFSKALLKFGQVLIFEDELAPTQAHISTDSRPTPVFSLHMGTSTNLTPSLGNIMVHLMASKGGTTKTTRATKLRSLRGRLALVLRQSVKFALFANPHQRAMIVTKILIRMMMVMSMNWMS